MNLRDFEYALAVERTRSFSRAAEACGVAQPTLSGQLRKLERELGVELFERDGRRLRATAVGGAILDQARVALAAAGQITALAAAGADPMVGAVRIGLIPTLAPYVLPELLPQARAGLPRAPLVVTEDVTPRLVEMLLEGRLDAALLATGNSGRGLSEIPLFDEPFWMAVHSGHALAARATASLREIEPSSLILLADGHCLRDQALALCGNPAPARGVAGDVRGTSLETLLNLVGAGMGSTIVPALALESVRVPNVALVPLDDDRASRRVRMVYRANAPRRRALSALAELLRACVPADRVRVL